MIRNESPAIACCLTMPPLHPEYYFTSLPLAQLPQPD